MPDAGLTTSDKLWLSGDGCPNRTICHRPLGPLASEGLVCVGVHDWLWHVDSCAAAAAPTAVAAAAAAIFVLSERHQHTMVH